MKIARYEYDNEINYGLVEDGQVKKITGDIFGSYQVTEETVPLSDVKLLNPVEPPNIIAIGRNYSEHARETGSELPERPLIFIKATTSVIGPGEEIKLPKMAPDEVDFEAELAIIIGKKASWVEEEEVSDYIMGYTCANDVSARDCQKKIDKQWARGKSFDTFCPLGPWIETELDPDNCFISSRLNGEVMQDSNTKNTIFSPFELVSYISKNMTLLPGTVVLTGTPEGVGVARKPPVFLREGDIIEVEIKEIGNLENPVVMEK